MVWGYSGTCLRFLNVGRLSSEVFSHTLLFRFSRVEVETKQWSASMPVSVVARQATTKRVDGSRKARDAY